MPTEPTTEASIESLLIGEWELVSQVDGDGNPLDKEINPLVLYEDGTCVNHGEPGTWKYVGGDLFVLGMFGGYFLDSTGFSLTVVSCDGNKLTLGDEDCTIIYKKVN